MGKIDIRDLSVNYVNGNRSFQALKDVTLDIREGEFISILGPSGCGKSTLLSILAGLNLPAEGAALIDGKEIRGPGKDRSVVFQDYSLFPWMTARQNVAFGISQIDKKSPRRVIRQRADAFLEKVELGSYKDKFVLQLSGGQQQRVSIARALAMDTEILLMDEPFGALDPKTRISLQKLLLDLWRNDEERGKDRDERRGRKTVVFVTHDVDEAIYLSDRIVVMEPDPGRIRKVFDVPYSRPRNRDLLIRSREYQEFRSDLLSYFYNEPLGSGLLEFERKAV